MNKKINIGLVQMSCVADVQANMQKAIAGIREAALKGANIVCLQELFTSQKYRDVNNSCKQTIFAPFRAASRIPAIAFCIFACTSAVHDIWTKPMFIFLFIISF